MIAATATRTTVEELTQYLFENGHVPDNSPPADEAGVSKRVKLVLKHTEPTDEVFTPDTQSYLTFAKKCKDQKKAIPMPADYSTVREREDAEEAEEETRTKAKKKKDEIDPDEDLIPAGLVCEPHHIVKQVQDLLNMVKSGQGVIPEFQRNLVWPLPKQQLFIESLLRGIPIPPITMAVDEAVDNKRHILDGMQRINTIKRFYNDELKIGDKKTGKLFSELSENMQNKFLFYKMQITEVHTERKNWPVIFRMINSGGVSLNEHEIRRATWITVDVPQIKIIDRLTKSNTWYEIFGTNQRYTGFGALLRAVQLHDFYMEYKKPMKTFLDQNCEQFSKSKLSKAAATDLHSSLELILEAAKDRLGTTAFRLPNSKQNNLGIIDMLVHGGLLFLENAPDTEFEVLGERLEELRKRLFRSEAVMLLLDDDTSGRENVQTRMKAVETRVDKILSKQED